MIESSRLALVVVDFQEKLLPDIFNVERILPRALKLIQFARSLEIPILWTEQYPAGLGPTVNVVREALAGLKPLEKTAFGCLADAGFASALKATGRQHLLIIGIETHVCVMQTALAAIEEGYTVFVPRDAVGSRTKTEYLAGLERMQRSGADLVTTEMAIFETLRVAGTPEFKRVLPLLK